MNCDKHGVFLTVVFYSITLEEWNHDIDHVHILLRGQPNTEISKFINAYKSAGSRLIRKEFPKIRKALWKELFWSQGFCLLKPLAVAVRFIISCFLIRLKVIKPQVSFQMLHQQNTSRSIQILNKVTV